jgi:hypothetical protein
MKTISFYSSNDVYQVLSEDEQKIYFQGSKEECENFVTKNMITEWNGPYAY